MSAVPQAVAKNGNGIDRQAIAGQGTALQSPAMSRALFAPKTPQEVWQLAEMLSQSNFIPDGYRGQPANIMVAMGLGSEVGLAPLQSLQNICVINGHPAIYGDALLALVMASPMCLMYEDGWDDESQCAWARTRREGGNVLEQVFSLDTAKRAGLLAKKGPWQQYPERMCKMRARSWLCRDVYPDVLKGLGTVRVLDGCQQPESQNGRGTQRPVQREGRSQERDITPEQAEEEPLEAEAETIDQEETPPEAELTEDQKLAVNMIIDALGDAETPEEMKAIKQDIKALPEAITRQAGLVEMWNTRRQQMKKAGNNDGG